MGKVCVSHDTLLITDNDSTTQDDKSPPGTPLHATASRGGFQLSSFQHEPTPSLAIARRGGFFSSFFSSQRTTTTTTSHVGWLSSSAACLCLHDNDDDEPCRLVVVICLHLHPRQPNNPPPRLQLRDGVGFLHPFF